jgi:hypothetical protein
MVQIFGYEIRRKQDKEDQPKSFAPPLNDDGAVNIESTAVGGAYGYFLDIEGSAKTESELVSRYRSMALQPEVQQAVDEIVNEAINIDYNEKAIEIVLEDTELPSKVKETIQEEFENVLRLLDFSNQGYDIFQRFFVDGRLNYHIIIDEKNVKRGVVELRYLDPRKIRLIRENDSSQRDKNTGVPIRRIKKEYYMYSDGGFGTSGSKPGGDMQSINGFRIAKDSIARVTSGLMNETQSLVLSHLHRAIKPLNQLRILEDATVIYTLTRAPERRVFYVDVGNLPKAKAEQYLADMMARHKNKLNYNSATGEVGDQRKFMTMTEDFWFPRREGNRATEIDTLAGGATFGDNDNLAYFQRKLYKSLGVPVSRLEPETMYSFGRVSEMTRDELRFSKFVRRLRVRFSILFDTIMEKQLILKGILTPEEWLEVKDKIRYDFMKDNYFEELKQMEILREKIGLLRDVDDNVGKYFSRNWVQKHVLFMNDEEIEEMQKEIDLEREAGVYKDPDMDDGGGDFGRDEEEPPEDGEKPPGEEEPTEEQNNLLINSTKPTTKFDRFKQTRRKYK